MRKFVFTLLILLQSICFAQTGAKVFFDKSGKQASEALAYYFRQAESGNAYKSYFVNGGGIYFEGTITNANNVDESINIYSGTCKWYYKNGKQKSVRHFNSEGKEDGLSQYYYENGKIWKEVTLVNGVMNSQFIEYDEQGQRSSIFQEDFSTNHNDWDVYTSDKSKCVIADGKLSLFSLTSSGTSRFVNVNSESNYFTFEANINTANLKEGEKCGLIFGFKDWSNYNFFFITNTTFFVGTIYEGVQSYNGDGMYTSAIKKGENNVLKIISGEKNMYSINGEIQFATEHLLRNFGSNIGFAVGGNCSLVVDDFIYKQIDFQGNGLVVNEDRDVKATGSGLLLSQSGYISTNYHVIEDAKTITVEITEEGVAKSYNATIIQKDIANDLAILKIEDKSFVTIKEALKYSVKESGMVEVGSPVFTIGFPYALGGMGKESKYTDGKVSARTGYNGAVNSYQTSIPVQPGNSGGPVFNDSGQLIGVINATIRDADNVSYAIKLNYLKTLIELLPEAINLPNFNSSNLSSEQKIKNISPCVVLIKVK
jgi:S1-C subfamily serine protease